MSNNTSTKPALPDGSKRFLSAFSRQHPDLDPAKAVELSNKMLMRMSEYMDQGYQPAVARQEFGGKVNLIILTLEKLGLEKGSQVGDMGTSKLYRIANAGRRLLQRTGEYGLFETIFTVDSASNRKSKQVRVSRSQHLLPPGKANETYISLREGMRRTGFSRETLRQWCIDGKVVARRKSEGSGDWMIQTESLTRYLDRS